MRCEASVFIEGRPEIQSLVVHVIDLHVIVAAQVLVAYIDRLMRFFPHLNAEINHSGLGLLGITLMKWTYDSITVIEVKPSLR